MIYQGSDVSENLPTKTSDAVKLNVTSPLSTLIPASSTDLIAAHQQSLFRSFVSN